MENDGGRFRFYYKFIRDIFVNSILLEISQDGTFYPFEIKLFNQQLKISPVIKLQ